MRLMADGTGLGTWEVDSQTGHTRFNEHWARMLGYERAQAARPHPHPHAPVQAPATIA